jgi:hypothetical protein
MAILATNIQKARHPMPSITLTLLIESEERKEVVRLHRSTISPAVRAQYEETLAKTSPDKEELIRTLAIFDVQSPDIVDVEGRPFPLNVEYLNGVDDSVLLAIWNSFQQSRLPNGQTSTNTNNG